MEKIEFKYGMNPEGMDYLEQQSTEKLIKDRKIMKDMRKQIHAKIRICDNDFIDKLVIKYLTKDINLITSEINYRAGMKRVLCHGGGIYD